MERTQSKLHEVVSDVKANVIVGKNGEAFQGFVGTYMPH